MKSDDVKNYAILGAIGFGLYWIAKHLNLFNPTSDKNIAYIGTSAVVAALTGDPNLTVGTWLYNITHTDPNYSDTYLIIRVGEAQHQRNIAILSTLVQPDGTFIEPKTGNTFKVTILPPSKLHPQGQWIGTQVA